MSGPTSAEKSSKSTELSFRASVRRWLRVWHAFRPFAGLHRRSFRLGIFPSLVVVFCHLALPWPIKTLLDTLLAGSEATPRWTSMELGLAFFLLTVLLGGAEYFQRLWVARFSIALVRDIRADAFLAASRVDPRRFNIGTGDLVARLVGDTARLKAGLKGFLTHFATNALLFLGMSVVLFLHSWQLGLIFLVAGIAVVLVTWWGTWRLYNRYRILRKKEGKLAMRIEDALGEGTGAAEFARVNRSSGRHEATVVQIQGQTTFLAHVLLGAATLFSLWIGMSLVESKDIPAGDLVLVTLYALKMTRPGVRLARQGTRIGKMLALGDRLERLLREGAQPEEEVEVPPLQQGISLKGICLKDSGKGARTPRLQGIDLMLAAGQRIAVVGSAGSGKSSLLALLAAQVAPSAGRLRWDGISYKKLPFLGLSQRIAFQAEAPFWLRKPLRELLQADRNTLEQIEQTLHACGLKGFLERMPAGIETVVGADELSAHQAQALALTTVLLAQGKDLVLLDEPFASLSLRQAQQVMERLAQDRWKTIIISMTRPMNLNWFDLVVALEGGRVIFEGTPRAWQIASSAQGEV